jgi:NAD(P)-dependent dehydrogenase (short-subunit alcohol dehydrogenase family)
MLQGKTIIVTGAASGIGAATAALVASHGAKVISVDINRPAEVVGDFIQADLSDKTSIDRLVAALPRGANGLANIAGLPPTRPADAVVTVNLVGLKYLTTQLVSKLADNASIVNLASLAGLGWPDAKEQINASANLDFGDVAAFCKAHDITGGRSYFFSKEALIVWTMQNRWTWRDRGIRMNAVSPGHIAPVVAFLLSDGSAWIRGTNIPTDGGMYSNVLCQMHGY